MSSAVFSETLAYKQNRPWRKLFWGMLIAYCSLWLISRAVLAFIVPEHQISSVPYEGEAAVLFVVSFAVFFLPLLYLFNCGLAKRWLKPDWKSLVLYMGATFACGALCEIVVDSLFAYTLGRPAWEYHIWPKHGGFTSGATAVVWAMYGFYLYFFHEALKARKSPIADSVAYKGILIAVDAMILETLANTFSLITFKTYYFFYLRPDLAHFTTWEIFVPYAICGAAGVFLLKLLDQAKYPRAWIGLAFYLAGLVEVFVLG